MKEIRQIIIDLCQAENYLESHKPNGFMNNLIEAHGAIGNLLNIELAKRAQNIQTEPDGDTIPNDDVVATVE